MHEYEYVLIGDRVISISKVSADENSERPEQWCVDCDIKHINQTRLDRVCHMWDVVEVGMVTIVLLCILLGTLTLLTAFRVL